MNRPVGIETEYGLNCEGFAGPPDFAFESAMLIHAAPLPVAFRGWDYTDEDPRRDLRGTRVDALEHDPNDLLGSTAQSSRMTREELLADTVLLNGARLYNDHNHPEYCTDACHTVADLVAQDRAGEALMHAAENAHNARLDGGRVRLVKNNTDYHGRSYGCHENYLTLRAVPLDDLVDALVPFLATRQIFAGAGRVGIEGGDAGVLQLSQRADFFETVVGINTTARRPIFNTRDEPHADRTRYRRLHVIAGDANRSEWATGMKAATTALVLDAVEAGWRAPIRLRDPVAAVRQVSHDLSLGDVVTLDDGLDVSPLDIQQWWLSACERFRGRDAETDWVLAEWRQVLADLRADPTSVSDRVDWAAKLALVRELNPEPEAARRLDFGYHLLDPALSVHQWLTDRGRMRTLVTRAQVEAAHTTPPSGTRAAVRGTLLAKFGTAITAMEWDRVRLHRNGVDVTVRLPEVAGPEIDQLHALAENASTIDDVVAALDAKGG
ncbi:MAG: proteasome accessory factor PafA2 family protein [Chloroflexi bacterium]|nr:proteasome accessory factor PafA2 family protein [Chloroflexota bacterium]